MIVMVVRANPSSGATTTAPVPADAPQPSSSDAPVRPASVDPLAPSPPDAWAAFSGGSTAPRPPAQSTGAPTVDAVLVAPGVWIRRERPEVVAPEKLEATSPIEPELLQSLDDDDVLAAVEKLARPTREVTYSEARMAMFSDLDNRDGFVGCVYTDQEVETKVIPDSDSNDGMNTEHTWPMSKGIKSTRAASDLHHLFPTNCEANSKRSSFPFGTVSEVKWERDGSKLGLDADGEMVYEPNDAHKGNVARSMFYVSSVYGMPIPDGEEDVLRVWHREDPVDEAEQKRNEEISRYQGNRNPFVDDVDLFARVSDF